MAAGAVGAAFIGGAAGYRNLISIDIGGTSADIGVDGAPGLTEKGHIGDGPLASAMIDLTKDRRRRRLDRTLFAGGSIDRRAAQRRGRAGPRRAMAAIAARASS